MGNCWFLHKPTKPVEMIKDDGDKEEKDEEEKEKEGSRLPTNPKEVEDLRRDAANPLIAFTFHELKNITKNFRQDYILGVGGFGRVYKGSIYKNDIREEEESKLVSIMGAEPVEVAIKVHDGDKSLQGHREWLVEQLPLWFMLIENTKEVLTPLSWAIRMKIALGAAKGLAFLHGAKKPIIFRDFKTSNILLDQEYNAKLSDFGLAKDGPVGDASHVSTRIMGTYGYAAPEYILTYSME